MAGKFWVSGVDVEVKWGVGYNSDRLSIVTMDGADPHHPDNGAVYYTREEAMRLVQEIIEAIVEADGSYGGIE